MPTPATTTRTSPRNVLQSMGALCAGFVAVVALSLGTDQILHELDVYPPWGQPMNDTSDNVLALAYRTVYGIIGSYIVARCAPYSPMTHALVSGGVGTVLSSLGVIAAMNMNLGPIWYPIGIVVTALPGAWVGGVIHRRLHLDGERGALAP